MKKSWNVLPGIDGITDNPQGCLEDDWDELLDIVEALDDVSDYDED